VAADASQSATFDRAALMVTNFANLVVVADLEAGGFAGVRSGPGAPCHRAERKEAVVCANFRWPFDGDVGNQAAAFAELDIPPNHAIGPNLAGRVNFGAGMDNRGGMNPRRRLRPGSGGENEWPADVSP